VSGNTFKSLSCGADEDDGPTPGNIHRGLCNLLAGMRPHHGEWHEARKVWGSLGEAGELRSRCAVLRGRVRSASDAPRSWLSRPAAPFLAGVKL
jgi:hypothetical protein